MSRLPRTFSSTGVYHIFFRGIAKQNIFEEDADFDKMLQFLTDLKSEMHFEIYAYCFMTNHVHLLLKEQNMGDISVIMKRLLTKYVMWFNKKYIRVGQLIAGRYGSRPVEVDQYFLSVVRYIHQNPLRANVVKFLKDYRWSSYNAYLSSSPSIVDKYLFFDIAGKDDFVEFHAEIEKETFPFSGKKLINDAEMKRFLLKEYDIAAYQLADLPTQKRNEILRDLKEKFSLNQIERTTGISRVIISRV